MCPLSATLSSFTSLLSDVRDNLASLNLSLIGTLHKPNGNFTHGWIDCIECDI